VVEEKRIIHLDGLRGLAIASVILFHAYGRWDHLEPWASSTLLQNAFGNGWLGVNLFFMISGFFFYWSLKKSSGLIRFGHKRWLRLFPAMFMATQYFLFNSFSDSRATTWRTRHSGRCCWFIVCRSSDLGKAFRI